MITPSRLAYRVYDREYEIDVCGFASPDDAAKWVREQNRRLGRNVYAVRFHS